jgi:predicted dehydrogenase
LLHRPPSRESRRGQRAFQGKEVNHTVAEIAEQACGAGVVEPDSLLDGTAANRRIDVLAVSAAFRFRNPDFIATMSGSAIVPYAQCFWSFALYGSQSALTVHAATGENLAGTPAMGPLAERIKALPLCSYPQSFDRSVMGFVEALHQGKPPPVTGEDGLAAMRLEAAVAESARTGRTVRLSG